MKIVRLQAEGFKRLVAVDITPEGNLVRIGGDNEAGKTSLLDSIKAAIGGAEAAPVKPVRTGEEYSLIRVDFGDLKVTRYFDKDGTTKLKLQNADGAEYGKAQTELNKLMGAITFDPLAFANMPPKDQAAELRRLVPLSIDLDEFARLDKADYAARRDVNRDGVALKARLEAMPIEQDPPAERPDRGAILKQIEEAGARNSEIDAESRRRDEVAGTIEESGRAVKRIDAEILELESAIAVKRAQVEAMKKAAAEAVNALEKLPPLAAKSDTVALSAELRSITAKVESFDRHKIRTDLVAELAELRKKSEGFTKAMADREAARAKAFAEAKMPIDGLGFDTIDDETVVTFNGEPFSQSSGAQRIKVSTALAIAANPKLRVCLIKDGSLLDPKNMTMLAEMADKHDFQIWIETVGEAGAGIIIEDGSVKGAPTPEKMEAPKRRTKAEVESTPGVDPGPDATVDGKVVTTSASPEIPDTKPEPRKRPSAMREFRLGDTKGGLFD